MAININLLPWREELRRKRERAFYYTLAAAVLLGVGVVFITHAEISDRINYQHARNELLKDAIAQLEEKITTIQELKETKKKLIARMNVIQKLQQGRGEAVHLLYQVVATLPEGLYLTSLKESGNRITVTGIAESNARISNYMKNLDSSHWLADPKLSVIEVKDDGDFRSSHFTLAVNLTNPLTSKSTKEGS